MYEIDGVLYLEPEDLCSTCRFAYDAKNLCPLIEALGSGVATLMEEPVIQRCHYYRKNLTIVPSK